MTKLFPLINVPVITDPIELQILCTPPGSVVNGTKKPAKVSVTLRIDEDIVEYYKDTAASTYHWKYQTMMNHALRIYMQMSQNLKTKDSLRVKPTV